MGDASVSRSELNRFIEDQRYALDTVRRRVDELLLFQRLAGAVDVDVVRFTGPPPRHTGNPTGQGAGNPLVIPAYVFIPRGLDRSAPQPLIVLAHGNLHAESGGAANIVRELTAQGYTAIAPAFRGSAGYGRSFAEQIDYGGLEIADVLAARDFALTAYPFLDPGCVGIAGWSHGGLIALLSIFDHPDAYAACYACAPPADLIARMGYKGQAWRDWFAAPYHIGKTVEEDVAEYRHRSPTWQAHRYAGTPLLIHAATNDEAVNIMEVEGLVRALTLTGKPFAHTFYEDAPGGHSFYALDTPLARVVRQEAYRFLAPVLQPASPLRP